jgi:hypothetical protein
MDYILTKGRYKTILEENLWCSGAKLGLKNWGLRDSFFSRTITRSIAQGWLKDSCRFRCRIVGMDCAATRNESDWTFMGQNWTYVRWKARHEYRRQEQANPTGMVPD